MQPESPAQLRSLEGREPADSRTTEEVAAGPRGTTDNLITNTKIAGVLRDLQEDIVNSAVALHMGPDTIGSDKLGFHLSGADSVYVEHHGRFTKAPKNIFNDFRSRTYKNDTSGSGTSPLDTAIWVQNTWSKVAKCSLGFLGGLALLEVILIVQLRPSNPSTWERFFNIYPFVDHSISCLMLVFITLSLVALLDWIDLGHFQMIQAGASFSFKKVVTIVVLLFGALVILLGNRPMDDFFYLHETPLSNFSYDALKYEPQSLKRVMINWEFLCAWKDSLIILAWILLILSKNEDLFSLHLVAMKKYDYRATA